MLTSLLELSLLASHELWEEGLRYDAVDASEHATPVASLSASRCWP